MMVVVVVVVMVMMITYARNKLVTIPQWIGDRGTPALSLVEELLTAQGC